VLEVRRPAAKRAFYFSRRSYLLSLLVLLPESPPELLLEPELPEFELLLSELPPELEPEPFPPELFSPLALAEMLSPPLLLLSELALPVSEPLSELADDELNEPHLWA
jgi:hypothetical protein